MTVYYNEIDPFAAEWLRQLISAGHIAPGDVDTRSIVDVRPDDLRGYTQCHFFAGTGVWSHALRLAGWPDDRPVWTGSCPCQPFSAAGKGGGFDDERHLWPHFHWLISQCGPPVVLGEQVASKDGLAWLDLVQADLEGTGYASGAVDTCAAGFGAPHIRQRLYWMAYADNERRGREHSLLRENSRGWLSGDLPEAAGSGASDWLADTLRRGAGNDPGEGLGTQATAHGEDGRLQGQRLRSRVEGASGGLADPDGRYASAERQQRSGEQRQQQEDGRTGGVADADLDGLQGRAVEALQREGRRDEGYAPGRSGAPLAEQAGAGPANGHWRDADWLFCRDGKWRPVEPGTFPLAHGAAARVGRLRGYGNAINAAQAQGFIEAVQDVLHPAIDLRLTDLSEMTTDKGDIFA